MGILLDLLFKRKNKKSERPFCSVVVPAAGSSQRMGGVNKLFMPLGGIPVLARTRLAIDGAECVDEIIVGSNSDDIEKVADLCQKYAIEKVTKIVCGGATRTESVYAGTFEVSKNADVIAVHDGARPLVTAQIFEEAVAASIKYNAAAPAVPVKDTVKTVKDGIVTSTPDRSTLYAVQTPQIFNASVFKAAMENARKKGLELSDDCMAVEAIDVKIHLTQGSYDNLKITTPEDIAIGEAMLNSRGSF